MKKRMLIVFFSLSVIHSSGPPPPPAPFKPPQGIDQTHDNQSDNPWQAESDPQTTPRPPQSATKQPTTEQNKKTPSSFVGSVFKYISDPSSEQAINVSSRRHTSADGSPLKINSQYKHDLPAGIHATARTSQLCFTNKNQTVKTRGDLFSDDATLSKHYTSFIQGVESTPKFIPQFRKIQIVALHQIYSYLVDIYTALNMTHFEDFKTHVSLERKYGLNKKTLIINHLIIVIQHQLNQALRELFPSMPQEQASHAGLTAIKHDYGTDLNFMFLNVEQSMAAFLGVNSISQNQCNLAVQKTFATIQTEPSLFSNISIPTLQKALKKVAHGPSFVHIYDLKTEANGLTNDERIAFVDALDAMVTHYTKQQHDNFFIAIIEGLRNKNSSSLSSGALNFFKNTVHQLAFGFPLQEEIIACKNLIQQIQANDTQPLSADNYNHLVAITNYILMSYENITGRILEYLVKQLKDAGGPTVITPHMFKSIQTIASNLLSNQQSIQNLSKDERSLLALGLLKIQGANKRILLQLSGKPLTTSQQDALSDIANLLQKEAFTQQDLTVKQNLALSQGLKKLSSATLRQLTENEISAKLSPDQQTKFTSLMNKIANNPKNVGSFLDKEDQQFVSFVLQQLNVLIQERIDQHAQKATIIKMLFTKSDHVAKNLFSKITGEQYEIVNILNTQLNPNFSFSSFTTEQRTTLEALLTLYSQAIISIRNNQGTPPAVNTLIEGVSQEEHEICVEIAHKMTEQTFSFDDLTQQETDLLFKKMNNYKSLVQKQEAVSVEQEDVLTEQDEKTIQTIRDITGAFGNIKEMQNAFLSILRSYLLFFTEYTQTLHQGETSTNYIGLTVFSGHAERIAKELQGTPLGTLNPPLFFYNAPTLRSLRLLPPLAVSIRNTTHVPLPTYGISLALSPRPNDNDPKYNNELRTLDGILLFPQKNPPRFFFKTVDGKEIPSDASQISTSLPNWLTKQTVPHSQNDSNSFEYRVKSGYTIQPPQGFYMNIPITMVDPVKRDRTLLRLYEQQILPQPDWLNDPDGVVTMLRGCLGDYQSLLAYSIFDPVMTMIFKNALGLANKDDEKKALDYIKTQQSDALKRLHGASVTQNSTNAGDHDV